MSGFFSKFSIPALLGLRSARQNGHTNAAGDIKEPAGSSSSGGAALPQSLSSTGTNGTANTAANSSNAALRQPPSSAGGSAEQTTWSDYLWQQSPAGESTRSAGMQDGQTGGLVANATSASNSPNWFQQLWTGATSGISSFGNWLYGLTPGGAAQNALAPLARNLTMQFATMTAQRVLSERATNKYRDVWFPNQGWHAKWARGAGCALGFSNIVNLTSAGPGYEAPTKTEYALMWLGPLVLRGLIAWVAVSAACASTGLFAGLVGLATTYLASYVAGPIVATSVGALTKEYFSGMCSSSELFGHTIRPMGTGLVPYAVPVADFFDFLGAGALWANGLSVLSAAGWMTRRRAEWAKCTESLFLWLEVAAAKVGAKVDMDAVRANVAEVDCAYNPGVGYIEPAKRDEMYNQCLYLGSATAGMRHALARAYCQDDAPKFAKYAGKMAAAGSRRLHKNKDQLKQLAGIADRYRWEVVNIMVMLARKINPPTKKPDDAKERFSQDQRCIRKLAKSRPKDWSTSPPPAQNVTVAPGDLPTGDTAGALSELD